MFFPPKSDLDWQLDAKCAGPGTDPTDWDVESLDPDRDLDEQAQELCARCPVQRACLKDAERGNQGVDGTVTPTVGVVRGGRAWVEPKRSKNERNKLAWIADYNDLIDEGFDHATIRERMGGIQAEAYAARLKRYGCKRDTAVEAKCKELVREWVATERRFTGYDFPFGTPRTERSLVLAWAEREGMVRKLGMRPHPKPRGEPLRVYGQPHWPLIEPTARPDDWLWDSGEVAFGVNIYGNVSLYA